MLVYMLRMYSWRASPFNGSPGSGCVKWMIFRKASSVQCNDGELSQMENVWTTHNDAARSSWFDSSVIFSFPTGVEIHYTQNQGGASLHPVVLSVL